MEKLKKILKISTPYFLILAFSLMGTYLVFFKGLNRGDDFFYHLPNILDKYNSLLNGQSLEISSSLAGGLGYGAGLFYSPLSHITVAFMGVILRVFGISLITTYKIILVITVVLSGVFTYGFAMEFTNGKKIAAVLASACVIIYPYRIFNMFCRVAFAEAFAFMFVPLFLCGVYEITHLEKDNIKIIPFLKLVIGASLLFLSHNLTALFVYIIGFIFFVVYTKRLISLFKSPKYIVYCLVSALLIIGISAVALFSQLELLSMDYYAVSNDEFMRTDIESVLSHVGREWNYSGFLNIPFLQGNGISSSYLFNGVFAYLFSCVIFVILDTGLTKITKLGYFRYLISIPTIYILVSLIAPRLEGYLGVTIFLSLYMIIVFLGKGREESNTHPYKNPLLWFSLSVVFLSVYAMSSPWIWELVPAFLRSLQFPWRLWSLVQMFLSILVGVFAASILNRKRLLAFVAAFVGLLMVLNMPLLEKRIGGESVWVNEVTNQSLYDDTAIGHQKEYCPKVYRDFDYTPRDGSLYYLVRGLIHRSEYDSANNIVPVALSGEATIDKVTILAPRLDMEITVTEKAEIQLPLFYYPGYKIYVDNGTDSYKIKPHEVDGLLSFNLDSGTYRIKTDFVGSPLRIAGKVITVLSSTMTLAILGYAVYSETKLKMLTKNRKNKSAQV